MFYYTNKQINFKGKLLRKSSRLIHPVSTNVNKTILLKYVYKRKEFIFCIETYRTISYNTLLDVDKKMQNESQDNDVLRKIECNCIHLEFLIIILATFLNRTRKMRNNNTLYKIIFFMNWVLGSWRHAFCQSLQGVKRHKLLLMRVS